MKVRLLQAIEAPECARRNALTNKATGYALQAGDIGTLLDTFDGGRCFLVEFGARDACEWLGMLQASEIDLLPEVDAAA
jgi:hypothetical protein